MKQFRYLALYLLALTLPTYAAPPVDDIVDRAIAAIERQDSLCAKYSNRALTQSIKYDKNMQPDEITTMTKLCYHSGKRISEQILAMNKDGKPLAAEEIAKQARNKNEEWEKGQKDPEKRKKASRENFIDPLSRDGRPQYNYFLIETRDSAVAHDSAAVAGVRDGDIFDQTVQKLATVYVIQARPKTPDERRLNATYWIEANSAGILRTVFAPSKMPSFVDTLHFEMDYAKQLLAGATVYLPSRFEMKGKAGFLFFKGRFGVIEEFSDYRCDDAIDESVFARRYWYRGEEESR